MHGRRTVLMLHDRKESLSQLARDLKKYNIDSVYATSCAEALKILGDSDPPQIVFTDLTISDGSWADALLLSQKSPVPLSLIVMSDVPDLCLCKAATACGAFGVTVPPLSADELQELVQPASEESARRRGEKVALAKAA